MLLRGVFIALLSVTLSGLTVQAIPAPQEERRPTQGCNPPRPTVSFVTRTRTVTRTSTRTVTATQRPPATTNVRPPVVTSVRPPAITSVRPPGGGVAPTSTNAQPPAVTTTPPPGNNAGGNDGNTGGGDNGGDTGGAPGGGNGGDSQTSLTLDPSVIAPGFANNGQDTPTEGQVPSLTSTNNFINFCLTTGQNLTNGQQLEGGSCNPAPIGLIPAVEKMPSSKFASPLNFGTLKAKTVFTVEMNIRNMETGNYVNSKTNYLAAPQTLSDEGLIVGHSHFVIQKLESLEQTTPIDPKTFVFFKGLNEAAVDGKLSAEVTEGLDAGFYKLSSINAAMNHQPVIVPVAQHGSLNDEIYFTVTEDGNPLPGTGDEPVSTDTATATATSTEASSIPSDSVSATDSATSASITDALPTDSVTDGVPTESVSDAVPSESVSDALPTGSVSVAPSAGSNIEATLTATPTDATESVLPTGEITSASSAASTTRTRTAALASSSKPCKTFGPDARTGNTPVSTETESVPEPEITPAENGGAESTADETEPGTTEGTGGDAATETVDAGAEETAAV